MDETKYSEPPAAKKPRISVVSPTKGSPKTSPTSCAHILPPECFGHALSFLPYSDVRSASRTGRYLAFQAAREADTINIYSPLEMNVRAGFKRFPNVTQVNIFCLQFIQGRTVARRTIPQDQPLPNLPPSPISKHVAERIVPFLTTFPHLEGAFVGGVKKSFDVILNRVITKECSVRVHDDEGGINESNNNTMEALIKNFCIAFEIGALPSDLKLVGLVGKVDEESYFDTPYRCPGMRRAVRATLDEVGCEVCQNVCQHFPVSAVCEAIGVRLTSPTISSNLCMGERVQLDILSKRHGWKEYTSTFYDPLEKVLSRSFNHTHLEDYTSVGGIPLLEFKQVLRYRNIPAEIFSLKQRYDDDGPDCEQLISEMISKYGFQSGIMPSQRLAQIIGEPIPYYKFRQISFEVVFVDVKTYQVLSSLGFKVGNLVVMERDRLPRFKPRKTLEILAHFTIMERIRSPGASTKPPRLEDYLPRNIEDY